MPVAPPYNPLPVFSGLGEDFSDLVAPADFPQATLRFWNDRWAEAMGLGDLSDAERVDHFHEFAALPDNQPEPRAVRYHGHQFRSYNPQIGDGRGFLFAQLKDRHGRLLDLGTKGTGQTPYSRSGDGRLTLKGAVREILATEMLEALGVYTSKTFAVYETGEQLYRNDEPSPTRSAVLTRLQHSHVRFGMFQRHAYFGETDNIKALVDYALEYLLHLDQVPDGSRRFITFLNTVIDNSARLVSEWMAAGFVHGVLNTDNLVVTGESFDYGPWRFLPDYEPGFTAAYFDETGLYAYARQPEAVYWALQQLAATLSEFAEEDRLVESLTRFPERYREELPRAFFRRLGLKPTGTSDDTDLVRDLLNAMQALKLPWEAVFFDWFCGPASEARAMASPRAQAYDSEEFKMVRERLMNATPDRPNRLDHQYFSGSEPVHMVIEKVEAIWSPIAQSDDWSRFEAALESISQARAGYDLGARRTGFLT